MKNYPNQASDVGRVRATLSTIRDLQAGGHDVTNDAVLGYELARRRYYTFRGLDYKQSSDIVASDIAARLEIEKAKNRGSQGTQTNAREMRRTLRDLGWISHSSEITDAGERFLFSQPGSLEERAALADGLWNLQVGTGRDNIGPYSHPVRYVLRLIQHRPSDRREGLELALEAKDDSEQEFARIRTIYDLPREARRHRLAQLGVSDATIANAVKIFPALAKTAGLIVDDGLGHLVLSPDGLKVMSMKPGDNPSSVIEQRAAKPVSRTLSEVSRDEVAKNTGSAQRRALTEEEQQRAAQQLADRTNLHQNLVKALAAAIKEEGKFFEDVQSFDLLFVPDDGSKPVILYEAKTIASDEDIQVRRAVGQLSWYHHFDVSPHWPDRAVIEVLAVDAHLPKKLLRYLRDEEIAVVQVGEGGVELLDSTCPEPLFRTFGIPQRDAE